MDIEAAAVSVISGIIAECPRLKPSIYGNDKTLLTDGHIDLYNGMQQNKGTWAGRVPVQVKGRTRALKKGAVPKHPISRTELQAFQKDFGVLYFLVTIDPRTKQKTPYYAILAPFAIQALLDRAPAGQKQISVQMKHLPAEADDIEMIVGLALKNRDQRMSQGVDPILYERIASFTLHSATDLDFDAPVILAPGTADFALVLNTTDGMSVPLNGEFRIYPEEYFRRETGVQLRCGTTAFENGMTRKIDDTSFEVEVSDGLRFVHHTAPDEQSTDVILKLESTLQGRFKTLSFFLSLIDTGLIEVNGNPMPIHVSGRARDAELRVHLAALTALTELFEYLGVDTRLIDLGEITDQQARDLHLLHRVFLQGHEVRDPSLRQSRILLAVGSWNLSLLSTQGSAPDKWRFLDPFTQELRAQFRWSADASAPQEAIPVTAYDTHEPKDLGTVLNARFSEIVGAYEDIAQFDSTYSLANHRVLALIAAAGETPARRDELLDAATLLNDWLLQEQGPTHHHRVNRWQILARREELASDERREIRALKRQLAGEHEDDSAMLEVACAIFLGDQDEIEDLLEQLPASDLGQMQRWPIWELRRDAAEE